MFPQSARDNARVSRRMGIADQGRPLSTRHRTILSMEMRGHNKYDIAAALDMEYTYVCMVTRSNRYIKAREALMMESDNAFLNLQPHAVAALADGLAPSTTMSDRLKAVDMYFKARGYRNYAKDAAPVGNVTAEDVVKQLLQVRGNNVQININNAPQDQAVLVEAAE